MQHLIQGIGKAIATISIVVAGLFGFSTPTSEPVENVGATIPIPVAVFQTSLQTSITETATSMTLVDGTDKAGNTISGYICFNIDEGTALEEFVCGTASGTSVTSMIRGIDPIDGDLEVTALKKVHRRGASVKVTNYPSLGILSRILNGQETLPNPITYATGVTPLNSGDLTDKEYVLSVVTGGAVSFEKVVLTGTAGESVVAGNLVYLKSDGKWWKTDADTTSTFVDVQLGIAQGTGSANASISGGVLTKGVDTTITGTAGNYAYVSNTAGAIGTTTGTFTKIIGQYIVGSAGLYFDPIFYLLKDGISQGVYGTNNKLISSDNVYTAETDQSQATQNSTIETGEADATTKKNIIAQSFIPSKTKIRGVKLYKSANTGTFTGDVVVTLQADSSGSPSGTALATSTIANATYNAYSVGEFDLLFASEYSSLVVGSLYWIVIDPSTSDNSNHPNFGINTAGGYASGLVKYWNTTDGYVAIATIDLYFKTINGITGQVLIFKEPIKKTYDYAGSPFKWFKPAGLKYVIVKMWGGGGGGTGSGGGTGTGGGGGSYIERVFLESEVGTTETVTIGAGGTGDTDGTGGAGGSSSFGSLLTANGGEGGTSSGGVGGTSYIYNSNGGAGGNDGAVGADGVWGGAGGGGGGSAIAGGISVYGGAGGAGGNNTTPAPTVGLVPGGGGGGNTATSVAGANGGAGRVIVIEFY